MPVAYHQTTFFFEIPIICNTLYLGGILLTCGCDTDTLLLLWLPHLFAHTISAEFVLYPFWSVHRYLTAGIWGQTPHNIDISIWYITPYIFFFHRKNLLVIVFAVGRPQLQFYQKVFSLYNSFSLPVTAGGCLCAKNNKPTLRPGVWKLRGAV